MKGRHINMHTRHSLVWAVIILLTSACSEPNPPLRIGITPWPGYELLHLADKLGYFNQEGVDVHLVEFLSLTDSRRAFDLGQLDAWAATPVELTQSYETSPRSPQAFYVLDVSKGADMILAEERFNSIAELKGQKVGAEPGTLSAMTLQIALSSAGLSLDDVELVPMPQYKIADAFQKGDIVAAATYPPYASNLQRNHNLQKLFDTRQTDDQVVDLLATDRDFIQTRRHDLAAVIRAIDHARLYLSQHPEYAAKIMAEHERITPEEMTTALKGIEFIPIDQQLKFLKDDGLLSHSLKLLETLAGDTRIVAMKTTPGKTYTTYTTKVVTEASKQ